MDHATDPKRLKCRLCGHVQRNHDPVCRNGCGCEFVPPRFWACPLGLVHHSGYGDNVRCSCVPGQIDIFEAIHD